MVSATRSSVPLISASPTPPATAPTLHHWASAASSPAPYLSLPPPAKARSFRGSSLPHRTRFAGLRRRPRNRRLAPQSRLFQRLQLRLPQRPLCITGHPPRRRPLHISRFRLRRKLALSAAPPCPTGPASLGSGGDPGIGDWLLSPAYFSVSNSACHSAHFASLGIRQSPRGDRATEPTLGPSGRQLRLNCWVKKRR